MKVNCVVLYLNGGKIKIIIRNHILGDVIAMDTVYMVILTWCKKIKEKAMSQQTVDK